MKFIFILILGAVLVACCTAEDRECARCVMKQRPVCGRNSHGEMQTFQNSCSLRRNNCVNNSDFIQVRKGSC